MKRQILALVLLAFTTLISCSKVNNKDMTVIKDCTGSYLRYLDRDYHICNIELVEGFENGDAVEASFTKIEKCETDQIVCYMLHENEGLIWVSKIR